MSTPSAAIEAVQSRIAELQAFAPQPSSVEFAKALQQAQQSSGSPATAAPHAGTTPAPRGSPGTMGDFIAARSGDPALARVGAPTGPAGPLGAMGAQAAAAPSGSGNRAIAAAEKYLGVPYKWGGTDPASGLDCSGFVQRVYRDLGIDLPRVSKDQGRAGQPVASLADARPGDLVYWNGTGGRPNHIGIYVGDGRMMHAPRSGDVVKYDSVRSSPPDAIRRVT